MNKCLILNDPVKTNTPSRAEVADMFNKIFSSRLSNYSGSTIILHSRLHEHDVTRAISKGFSNSDWPHLVLPVIEVD